MVDALAVAFIGSPQKMSSKIFGNLLELKRRQIIRVGLLPATHSLCRTDELEKVISFRRFDHRRAQTIVCIVMRGAAAGGHLSHVGSRNVNSRYFQTVDR